MSPEKERERLEVVRVNPDHFLEDSLAVHSKLFKVTFTLSSPTETDAKERIRDAQNAFSRRSVVALLIIGKAGSSLHV